VRIVPVEHRAVPPHALASDRGRKG
jgi:hypothetical protein